MKSKMKIFITALFISVCTLSVNSQITSPKGKVQLIEFTNSSASFTVPEGKTWYIYSIFSDFIKGGEIRYDEDNKQNFLDEFDDIRIFLKDLNGIEKTNYQKIIYGTQFYHSHSFNNIPFPVVFPEKTSFNLIILKGDLGRASEYSGKAYISLIEVDN